MSWYTHDEAPAAVHICYFTDSLHPSGVGVHLLNLLRWLDLTRFQVSLVCPETEDGWRLMTRAARLGATIHPMTVRDHWDHAAAQRLVDLLRSEGVAIFHSQVGISWEGMTGLRAAHRAGVPVRVVTEHLPYLLTHPGQVAEHRETTPLAHRVITVSEEARRSFLLRGYPEGQFICIHNGIEPLRPPATGTGTRARAELGVAPEAPVLLTVARMTPQKGYDVLLAAAPAVLARYPDAQFVWVGEGPEREALAAGARDLGVAHAVRFLGHRDDVPSLMSAADLLVLPSRFEGHPIVALEALSMGLAVVGTRVCGMEEAVADGETGLLAEPEQPEALSAAIVELLADPSRRERMGQAGRLRVHRHFTARLMAKATMDLYDELLAEHLPRPYRLPGAATLAEHAG
ncbi:MAG: glycosyltransferase family 4 protein [Anaerolineae bacterium]|nr:glycosyltransferase family 4 protein [Anaerolineae bacterium]